MIEIALVVDTDNWAFYNIAKNIKANSSKKYNFHIIPSIYLDDNIIRLWLLVEKYDWIHFFWRGHINFINTEFASFYLSTLGGNLEEFMENYVNFNKISTGIYDHLFLDDDIDTTSKIINLCPKYYTSSIKLFDIYSNVKTINSPWGVITDGINLKQFFPSNLERFDNINSRKIIIGWVGNSAWSAEKEDFKGVNTILKPAIAELINEGYNIDCFFADRQEKMIPHDEMVDYYSKVDIYVCTSKLEGTPNPVLESMACGVPIITTDVGIVNELLGEKQKKFILKNRTVPALKEKIIDIVENKVLFKELSEENLNEIKKWDWKYKTKEFEDFFDFCLESERNK